MQERLEAEKAAKFMVEQEKESLQGLVDSTLETLQSEQAQSAQQKRVLKVVEGDLKQEKAAGAALGEQVVDLSAELERENNRADGLTADKAQLEAGAPLTVPPLTVPPLTVLPLTVPPTLDACAAGIVAQAWRCHMEVCDRVSLAERYRVRALAERHKGLSTASVGA